MRTATQWGIYDLTVDNGKIVAVDAIDLDPRPSTLGTALVDGIQHPLRIARPAIRRGWLNAAADGKQRTATMRGEEPFVEVPWDEALELAAQELTRVIEQHGNSAIFAGSYGWASADHTQRHSDAQRTGSEFWWYAAA